MIEIKDEEFIADLQCKFKALKAAQSVEELDGLYKEWIGYSVVADDPQNNGGPSVIRATLFEYLQECASELNIDWNRIA